jgi:hypothetical protein
MKQKSGPGKAPAERVLKDIWRQTRQHYSAEEKIRIVLEELRGDENISELPPRRDRRLDVLRLVQRIPESRQASPGRRHGTCCDLRRGEGPSPGSLGVEGGRGRPLPGEPPAQKKHDRDREDEA